MYEEETTEAPEEETTEAPEEETTEGSLHFISHALHLGSSMTLHEFIETTEAPEEEGTTEAATSGETSAGAFFCTLSNTLPI